MSGTERGKYSALQKIQVMCKTCGVSESFYSNVSVERFRSNHSGHDIDGGGGQGMPSEAHEVKSAPKEEEPLEGEAGMKLAKVIVDLLVFPALPNPVFRVRGFRDNLEAFVSTSPFEQSAKVREMLASGDYVDHDFSGLRYVWESDAIEYEGDARERLGLPDDAVSGGRIAENRPGPRESPQDVDQSSVARTNEILFASPRRGEIGETKEASLSVPSAPTPTPHDGSEISAPPSPSRPTQELPPEHEMTKSAPRPPVPVKPDEKKALGITSQEAAARSEEEAEDEHLLVSKSWYIQGGKGNKREAVRISNVLKAFRWKVEPVYTIGVILDDILSIETSRNQISRTLIRRIEEDAAYRLTAVTTDQGKPVAWFKKEVPEMPPIPGSAAGPELETRIDTLSKSVEDERPRAEESLSHLSRDPKMAGANEPDASSLDDLEAEVEPDLTG